MCTAIQYGSGRGYFGRNLDLHMTYGESVTVTPRRYPFAFLYEGTDKSHAAMIGMAVEIGGMPMYFDAVNEFGVCAAALNFPDDAVYRTVAAGRVNLASFEVIPYVLCRCRNMSDVRALLSKVNVTADYLSKETPSSPLHWMFSDGVESVVLESVADGVHVYDCSVGVLSNSPDFPRHMKNYERMGEVPPQWDYSSTSRFLKGVSVRTKTPTEAGETASVNAAFHILSSVSVPKGSVVKEGAGVHYTRYTSVCSPACGKYYFNTYGNSELRVAGLNYYDLDGTKTVKVRF